MTQAEIRARESRWAVPVAATTFAAVALMVASAFVSSVSGTGDAAILRSVDANSGSVTASGLMQALGFALLSVPLVYLLLAARARSSRVGLPMVALMIAAPLFLAVSSGLAISARHEAADHFVAGEAKPTLSAGEAREKCISDRKDEGPDRFGEEFEAGKGQTALAACETRKTEDDAASNAIRDAALATPVSIIGIIGGFGFAAALLYCCLWAMRTGLLSRFWGSLGMALGVAALLGLVLFTLIWFVYFGLLVLGFLPGGRPPAWETGEAAPWPTPGERAAAELEPADPERGAGSEDPDADGEALTYASERRKRKQRDTPPPSSDDEA